MLNVKATSAHGHSIVFNRDQKGDLADIRVFTDDKYHRLYTVDDDGVQGVVAYVPRDWVISVYQHDSERLR